LVPARLDQRTNGSSLDLVLDVSQALRRAGSSGSVLLLLAICSQAVIAKEMSVYSAVLSVGEIYGGMMTFFPEWISGQPSSPSMSL
jgi:hypothetical protein